MRAGPQLRKKNKQDQDKLLGFDKAPLKRNNSDLWPQSIVGCP